MSPQGHPGFAIVFRGSSRNVSTFLNGAGISRPWAPTRCCLCGYKGEVWRHVLASPPAVPLPTPGAPFPFGCLHGEGERKREFRWFPWQQQGRACCLGDGEARDAESLRESDPQPQLPPCAGPALGFPV